MENNIRNLCKEAYYDLKRKHNVVMFHFGRTGSSVTANLIGGNKDIYWADEIYEECNFPTKKDIFDKNDPFKILHRHQYRSRLQYFGFELKVFKGQHIDKSFGGMPLLEFIRELELRKFDKFILLKRENFLQQYFSSHYGWQTSRWFVSKDEEKGKRLDKITLPVNPATMGGFNCPLRKFFDKMNEVYSEIENSPIKDKLLVLSYENDILKDEKVAYKKIMKFIGYSGFDESVEQRLTKGNRRLLKDSIINFDEVSQALKDTPYEWMLNT